MVNFLFAEKQCKQKDRTARNFSVFLHEKDHRNLNMKKLKLNLPFFSTKEKKNNFRSHEKMAANRGEKENFFFY